MEKLSFLLFFLKKGTTTGHNHSIPDSDNNDAAIG